MSAVPGRSDAGGAARSPLWRRVLLVASLVGGAGYLALGYVAAATPHPPGIALWAGFVPMALIALGLLWQLPRVWRWLALGAWLALVVASIVWLPRYAPHAALIYFVQHAGAMFFLAATFGLTLFGGHRQALCSRIAAHVVSGEMDARYWRYTWQVTLAWTLFFLVVGVASVALFVGGAMQPWAVLASVVTPVAVGLMFVVEYLIRIRVLPGVKHLSVSQTIAAYQKYRSAAP